MRASFVLLCVWAAFLALPEDARAAQILANGGFEEGIAGWRTLGGTIQTVDSPVVEGSRAGQLTLVAPSAHLLQHVNIVSGASYRLSGQFFFAAPTISAVHLRLVGFDLDGAAWRRSAAPLLSPTGAYQPLSLLVELPCVVTADRLEVIATGDAGSLLYVDDLRLELVTPSACPAPTRTPLPTDTATPTPVASLPEPTSPAPPGAATLPAPAATVTASPPPSQTPSPHTTATALPGDTPRPGAIATAPEASPTPSHGLLINGGFETANDGRPIAWRVFGGSLVQADLPVRDGSFAGAFASATASTKWLYQTVPVSPNGWYEFAGYLWLDDPGVAAAFLRISWYSSVDGSGSAVANDDSTGQLESPLRRYRYLTTGPVLAPPGVRSARVRVLLRPASAASALIYIDDVSFRLVPPPVEEDASSASERDTAARSPVSEPAGGLFAEVSAVILGQTGPALSPRPGLLPTPVLVRRAAQPSSAVEGQSTGGAPWWPWALAGIAFGLGAASWGAYWWGRKQQGRIWPGTR